MHLAGLSRFGRLLGVAAVLAASFVSVIGKPALAAAKAPTANSSDLSQVELPGDLGQADFRVYIPETKHSLRGYFLDYWRANGAASVYGNPISEPYASGDGRYSQAFENGIFQYFPEYVWTDLPSVMLQPIAQNALNARLDTFRRDGRRGFGGGDRRASTWSPLNPASSSIQKTLDQGGKYFEETGHTISRAFNDWYDSHEGFSYLGYPVSQPVADRGVIVQYFDGAVLIRDSSGVVSVAPIVKELASTLGIDTTPIARDGLPDFSETLLWTMDNPNPQGAADSPGKKWIEVSISQQTLFAYQGDTLITSTYVSTGISPNNTEQGVFHVRYKQAKTDMAGTVGPDGSVIALGEEAAEDASGNESAYTVKDVPDVMYINADAEALHGAYWHNNFGTPMSHGCINLPLNMAHFLFGWAPLGTMVWVHA